MLSTLLAPLSPFGLIFGAAAFVAALTPSTIPAPVLQGVECGLAFAVHSWRQASFRRTNTRFSKVDLDPLSESEAASFPNGPVMSSNSCEEKLSPPAKFPAGVELHEPVSQKWPV
jgi:hypothetical protein